jgi:hypothetical protein
MQYREREKPGNRYAIVHKEKRQADEENALQEGEPPMRSG